MTRMVVLKQHDSETNMGEILLLLVMFLIFSTTIDMLTSQVQHTYKHKSFIPSARKKCMLKIFIITIILTIILTIIIRVLQFSKLTLSPAQVNTAHAVKTP